MPLLLYGRFERALRPIEFLKKIEIISYLLPLVIVHLRNGGSNA
jgi:hypothetical protein